MCNWLVVERVVTAAIGFADLPHHGVKLHALEDYA